MHAQENPTFLVKVPMQRKDLQLCLLAYVVLSEERLQRVPVKRLVLCTQEAII